MFDGSYDDQLGTIFAALPKKRQTLLFTATITDSLEKLKEVGMNKPFYYEAPSKTRTADLLEQKYVLTPMEARDGYLVHVIQMLKEKSDKGQMIVFVKMCKTCEVLSLMLRKFEFSNVSLHSQKPQKDRLAALARFRSKQAQILIATDVASRGLDIPAVEFVINHDVPQVSKNYVHRVGRTARAGRRGLAVTLVTPTDVILIKAIEELICTELEEMTVSDSHVAEILTQVNVTKREQEIILDKNDFEEKRKTNKRKKMILEGLDPDEEEKRRNKERRKRLKKELKERKRRKREAETADEITMKAD